MRIRAKFRCMKVSQTWENIHEVDFRPVYQKRGDNPYCNSEENQRFWDATPAGEASLTFAGPHEFKPGAYYYIDMVPNQDGYWGLSELKLYGSGSYNAGDVWFMSGWNHEPGQMRHGQVKMTIRFPETIKLFGDPGGKWDVTFTFAENSDS